MFDLVIPPGTPRKMILAMAREFDLEIKLRNDLYVPIGISDIQRELLVIRGDEKALRKVEKLLFEKLQSFADDTVGPNSSYEERIKASSKAKKASAKPQATASAKKAVKVPVKLAVKAPASPAIKKQGKAKPVA